MPDWVVFVRVVWIVRSERSSLHAEQFCQYFRSVGNVNGRVAVNFFKINSAVFAGCHACRCVRLSRHGPERSGPDHLHINSVAMKLRMRSSRANTLGARSFACLGTKIRISSLGPVFGGPA